MCGIYTTFSDKPITSSKFLVSLKDLEYRGYDSAGITFFSGSKYKTFKTLKKISDLQIKVPKTEKSKIIIGHTRWATHGKPSIKNSHPHIIKDLAIVHNGVIENFDDLKNNKYLSSYEFKTETDTELILLLIHHFCKKLSFKDSVLKTSKLIKGSNAFICSKVNSDKKEMVAYKNNTPLYFGIKLNGERVFSSDLNSIKKNLKGYYYLENNEIFHLEENRESLFSKDSTKKKIYLNNVEVRKRTSKRKIKDSITYSEIKEQKSYILQFEKIILKIQKKINAITKPSEIVIIGCGSSYNVGNLGKIFIEKNSKISVSVFRPSEYFPVSDNKNRLFIFISQSGETADVCSLLESNQLHFKNSLSIVNNNDSRLVRDTSMSINLDAGIEKGVAATKTFTAQTLILYAISKVLENKNIKIKDFSYIKENLINKIFRLEDNIKNISKKYSKFKNLFVLGRNYNFPIATEIALKIKEIAYIHAEGGLSSEIKHGPIALLDKKFPVILLISNDKKTIHNEITSLNEIVSRTTKVVVVAQESVVKKFDMKISSLIDIISIPDYEGDLVSLTYLIPLQLLSYHLAKNKSLSIDQPRNLAKVVTVE